MTWVVFRLSLNPQTAKGDCVVCALRTTPEGWPWWHTPPVDPGDMSPMGGDSRQALRRHCTPRRGVFTAVVLTGPSVKAGLFISGLFEWGRERRQAEPGHTQAGVGIHALGSEPLDPHPGGRPGWGSRPVLGSRARGHSRQGSGRPGPTSMTRATRRSDL